MYVCIPHSHRGDHADASHATDALTRSSDRLFALANASCALAAAAAAAAAGPAAPPGPASAGAPAPPSGGFCVGGRAGLISGCCM